MEPVYKVIFKGQIEPGYKLEGVKENLTLLIKCSPAMADKLFNGKSYALAKDLPEASALEKQKQFKAIGLVTTLKAENISADTDSSNPDPVTESKAQQLNQSAKKLSEQLKQTAQSLTSKAQSTAENLKNAASPNNTGHDKNTITKQTKSPKNWQQKYFKVVGYFSFFCATIAILVVLLVGSGIGIKLISSSASVDVEQVDTRFSNLEQQLEKQEDARYESTAVTSQNDIDSYQAEVAASFEFQKNEEEYFAKIETNLNSYAKVLGQRSVKEKGSSYYMQTFSEINNGDPKFIFWKDLLEFTEDLDDSATSISEYKNTDKRKVEWPDAISWFINAYMENIAREANAEQEQDRNFQKAFEATTDGLVVIGIAFSIFMYFTMILALLRIEANTRNAG
ncbi:hypothetical protein [Pseudoalteromonas atlantica]|uniref:hypothetical protein n=1 Tax=Pseudoalteromonas atlantica TaxID=288 RepID=UPI000BBCF354|nr:hypothetical protein [Pseudoalteromonas atlantica]